MSDGIIAISGLAGSGKNTVGKNVAAMLGWRVVEPTFKDLARAEGISLEEFQKKAAADFGIDRKFDAELKRQCEGGKCVVTTWLGPWMAGEGLGVGGAKVFRVWIDVSLPIRAKRVAGREGISVKEAREHIEKRDKQNVERYKKVYKINILDHNKFDLVLKGGKPSAEEIAKKVVEAYRNKNSQ